jgi:hypothetical protein
LSNNPDMSPGGTPAIGGEALARALAAAHDALAAKIALLELGQASGELSPALAGQQAAAAMAVYERDCGLARVAAETGWETWTGVGGVLYARLAKSSPPKVVRAADPAGLRAAIGEALR